MFTAEITADAATDILVSDVDTLGLDTVSLQCGLYFAQCAVGAAAEMRTAVYNQYLYSCWGDDFNLS